MKVYVTALGLRPFRVTEKKRFLSHAPMQYKGQYKLPKNTFTGDGKKWTDLDYWFKESEILDP